VADEGVEEVDFGGRTGEMDGVRQRLSGGTMASAGVREEDEDRRRAAARCLAYG
jgi:hypothetical protein